MLQLWSGDPTEKPPFGSAEIDWGHPLANALSYCAPLNEFGGVAVDNVTGVASDAAKWDGRGIITSTVSTNALAGVYLDSAGTVAWSHLTTNVFNDSARWFPWGAANILTFSYQHFTDNNLYVGWWNGTERRIIIAASAANCPSNTWNNHLFTWSSSAGSVLYLDGVSVGSNGTGTSAAQTSLPNISIHGEPSTAGFNGTIGHWYYYRNRVLPAGEIQWLSAEPYAMFRPIMRRRWFVPSATGKLYRPADLGGLGSCGPFFHDPLTGM